MSKKTRSQILVSQPEGHNLHNINILSDFDTKNGSKSCHSFSLYDALMELCKEKKMHFFKPTPYVNYSPARLSEGRVWTIIFYVTNPETGKLKRVRIKFNRISSITERRKAAKAVIACINEKLALGWNPLTEAGIRNVGETAFEAFDAFLTAKSREVEYNSMRVYKNFVKTLKEWMTSRGFAQKAYLSSFTSASAKAFMDEVDRNVSPQTYNNYLRFYVILFNWLVEREYMMDNPFSGIRRKPKKLIHKKRRILSDEELERLWSCLENQKGYMVAALLCYCCFLRPKEIVLLKCGDVDLDRQVIRVRSEIAKNDNESERTIPDVMMKHLKSLDLSNKDWYLVSGGKGDFHPGPKKICSQRISEFWEIFVRKECGFGMDVQFYSLKDSGITNMIGAGVPVSFVKQQADHSSLSITSIYLGRSSRANEEIRNLDIVNRGAQKDNRL